MIGFNLYDRLLAAVFLLGIGLTAYWLINRLILAQARGKVTHLEGRRSGRPMLLYFTTPTCAPCKTIQRPAIQRVIEKLGDALQVIEVDASVQTEMASQWKVLSVPTTFVIDGRGKPRHINHGVTSADKLLKQIETLD